MPVTTEMTHRERVFAALKGQRVDRTPVSMWRHFFASETNAEGLAGAMLGFQKEFDWDFMKVNPRASYHVEDWGVRTDYQGDNPPIISGTPIRRPDDWARIRPLDPSKGVLGEQLRALEIIGRGLKGEVPFLMTVFNPVSVASRLVASEDIFLEHLRQHDDVLKPALTVITETLAKFSAACLERGASGIFLATTAWATTSRLTEQEYRDLVRPYDLALLSSLQGAEFHVLHVCRSHNMMQALADYPVHAFNWDCWAEGNPSLDQGRRLVPGKCVIGGVPNGKELIDSQPMQLRDALSSLLVTMGRDGWMLGPGCTYDPGTPAENVRVVRNAV